ISPAKATWRCSRRCPPPTALPALMSRSWILVEAGQQASKPVCRRPRSENSHGGFQRIVGGSRYAKWAPPTPGIAHAVAVGFVGCWRVGLLLGHWLVRRLLLSPADVFTRQKAQGSGPAPEPASVTTRAFMA